MNKDGKDTSYFMFDRSFTELTNHSIARTGTDLNNLTPDFFNPRRAPEEESKEGNNQTPVTNIWGLLGL